MSEPAALPVRSKPRMKCALGIAAGTIGLVAAALAWRSVREPAPAAPAPTKAQEFAASPIKPPSKTVRISEPAFHPWPPKPEVVGPPAGTNSSAAIAPSRRDPAIKPLSMTVLPEPAGPSLKELKEESLRDGDQLSAEAAREVLLDDKKSSALKLAVIDKLRTQDPEEAVPVLVAFLEHPASPAAAYTKPTAVKALTDFRDPRADQALEKLARSSSDERVRLTIAALQAKERSK